MRKLMIAGTVLCVLGLAFVVISLTETDGKQIWTCASLVCMLAANVLNIIRSRKNRNKS